MGLPALKFSINTARETDPTRTIVLRGQFVAQVNKRFRDLKGAITQLLTKDNFLEPVKPTEYQPGITLIGLAAKYEYQRSDVKVDQFMDWLKDQESQGILEIVQRPGGLRRGQSQAWTDTYIRSSYQKGIAQARADLRTAGADIPSFQSVPGGVAGVFNRPFHADRVALIYTRCFNEMEGVTEAMNGYLSRELALGMAEGQSPYQIARRINEKVDNIGIVRGRLIARTEVIQSHNEAALNEYERAEVEIGETVKVEWVATMDDRVRTRHAEWNGKVYDRDVARGMFGEPNCRCGLAPWVESLQKEVPVKKFVAEKLSKITPDSKATAEEIMEHYKKSKNATFIKGKSSDDLKADVSKRLGRRMHNLNIKEWEELRKELRSISDERLSGALIRSWSMTSGNKDKISIMMQLSAEKEFGLKGSSLWWDKTALKEAKSYFKTYGMAIRRFLREMYNDTQEHLKKQGLKTIKAIRGHKGYIGIEPSTIEKPMTTVNIQLQPMSSFSSDFEEAKHFASIFPDKEKKNQYASLFFAEVPADRVLSCPVTGYGCKKEVEWVILGQQAKEDMMQVSVIKRKGISWDELFGEKPEAPPFVPLPGWEILTDLPKIVED